MSGLSAERPPEFTDDERWWKWFSRSTVIVLLVSLCIAYFIFKIFSMIHLVSVGVVLGILLVLSSVIMTMIPVPGGDVLHGSGLLLWVLLYHMFIRKKSKRIYVKKVGDKEGEDYENN